MLLVEKGVQRGMAGLNLRLRSSAQEAVTLSELCRVSEHVQLREWLGVSFRLPVLLDVIDCGAPGIYVGWSPVARMEKRMMQLLQPAGEDGVRGLHTVGESCRCPSSCEDTRAAFFLDELADLRSVEIIQVALSSASSRMDGRDGCERRLQTLLAEQLTECVDDDAIADAEEDVEGCWYDALRRDGEERLMRTIDGMPVSRSAITSGVEEVLV